MRFSPVLSVLALLALFGLAVAAETKDPNAGVVTDPAKTEVYTTEKGTKYHTKDCPSGKIKVTLAESLIEADEPCAKCSPPVYDPAKVVVFTSDSGKKYHLASCRYAKTASNLKEVLAQGFEACGTCKPPLLWTLPKADPAAKPADVPAKPTPAGK